ncbi:MAG: TetR/AcrR family transcriptional regulator [Candidatus Lindowbacteria bacterium]|nr:TetR/AcrR family transcriptional regulator [Candidatus Lindowbacteria bacterium]
MKSAVLLFVWLRLRRAVNSVSGQIVSHHFTSKEMLAAAVYVQGLNDYQTGLSEALARERDARVGINAIVRYHLYWVKENPHWARYLQEMRHAEFVAASEQTITELNRNFMREVVRWVKPHFEGGAIRRIGLDLFFALVIGPCQEYTRIWLSGQARTELAAAVKQVSEAAWLAVRGRQARHSSE